MHKYLVRVPDPMQELLIRAAEEDEITASHIIRVAVSEYLLKRYGVAIDPKMSWGGDRRSKNDDAEE